MEDTMEMSMMETAETAMIEKTASKGKGIAKGVGAAALVGAIGILVWKKIKKAKLKKAAENANTVVEGEIVTEEK